MLRVQAYPVMDGLEVWVAWNCAQADEAHKEHRAGSVHRYVSREELDERGADGALAHEMTITLHEFPDAAARATC